MSIGVLSAGNSADDQIAFEVNADKVRTWQDAKRSGAARWATHDVYAGKPRQEFLGPGLAVLSLSGIRLDIERGVVPSDELKKMRRLRDTGAVLQFTLGDKVGELVGDFIIKDVDEEWKRVWPNGVIALAIVTLSLEEYQ